MKTDNLIRQRFSQLEDKAKSIAASQRSRDRHFAQFSAWATNALSLLDRVFGENSIHYQNFYRYYNQSSYSNDHFEVCQAIFQAAREDYEAGYLFKIRALIKAETLVDVIDQAEILKNAGYIDTSCIMAGVALEIAVKEIATCESVALGKFSSMNEQLWKKGIYNQAMWEQLKTWYTRRSEPAHGNFGQSTPRDADDMIKGIRRFIAEHLYC